MQAFNLSTRSLWLAFALMGCVAAPAPAPAPLPDPTVDLTPGWNDKEPDTCGVSRFAHLVGQPVGRIHTAGLPGIYRVLAPGEIATQDYYPRRADVQVDAKGIVTRLTCG